MAKTKKLATSRASTLLPKEWPDLIQEAHRRGYLELNNPHILPSNCRLPPRKTTAHQTVSRSPIERNSGAAAVRVPAIVADPSTALHSRCQTGATSTPVVPGLGHRSNAQALRPERN